MFFQYSSCSFTAFRLQTAKVQNLFDIYCVFLCFFMRFYALLRSIGVVVRDCVRGSVKDDVRGK